MLSFFFFLSFFFASFFDFFLAMVGWFCCITSTA
jgi:hypothetical protein